MKVRSSLKSLKRKPGATIVRRHGRTYVTNKLHPRGRLDRGERDRRGRAMNKVHHVVSQYQSAHDRSDVDAALATFTPNRDREGRSTRVPRARRDSGLVGQGLN